MKKNRQGRYLIAFSVAALSLAVSSTSTAQSADKSVSVAAGGKALVQLTTVDQRDGKVHGQTIRRLCVPAGDFPAHLFIGQLAADSSCKLVQAPAGEGSFFRFSCEGGNVSISGSVRKQSPQGFTTGFVEAIGADRYSRGIVAAVVGTCP